MRLILHSWLLQFTLLSRSPFFLSLALITPLGYCTIALLMLGPERAPHATMVVFGSGLLGAWSTTLFGAAESLYMQRFTGTLGMIAASPSGFFRPVLGFSLACATLGVYSVIAVALWAWLGFGVQFSVVSMTGVLLAGLVALLALVAIGMVLAAYYLLSRQAMTISNSFEYPIWITTGLLIPAGMLWPPLAWLGKVLPLGWAVDAVRSSVDGGEWILSATIAAGLCFVYLAIARLLLGQVDHRLRVTGELELR